MQREERADPTSLRQRVAESPVRKWRFHGRSMHPVCAISICVAGWLFAAGVVEAHEPIAQPNIFDPSSTPAYAIRELSWLVLGITGGIFALVAGLLAYILVRFRGRTGDKSGEPSQIYGSPRIELAWTLVPLLIVVVLFLTTARYIFAIELARPKAGALEVTIVGHQWWWEIRYPALGVVTANELHLPLSDPPGSDPTFITLQSADVIHSFWVPQLAGKLDLIPNKTNRLWLEPLRPGTYVGQCAQFCGVQHAGMLLRVVVHPKAEFEAWVAAQRAPAVDDPSARPGRQVFESVACVSCHTVRGTRATGVFGPDLTHLMSRTMLGSGITENTTDHLHAWVNDPTRLKPGVLMPAMALSPEDLDQVVAYLATLR
ncbi:MAG TPA: cytochrome c oxidase subunit II [Myxococcota bacterium]|nr:cytochrome c oxidase subunit II [Myxococcota bacterium]